MRENLIVGTILKPQGIRGELKVKPYTDSPEDFKEFKNLYLDGEKRRVLSVRVGDGMVFLGLSGVPDRNAAELLRGKNLELDRDEAPEPEEGRYYIVDLLGLAVVTEEGEEIGTLTDIRQAASDIYTVQKDGKDILFPAVSGVVKEVDLEGGRIVVDKTGWHRADISIIMLASQCCNLGLPADRCPNTLVFVQGHGNAVGTAAHSNSA